jgi:tRNA-2-methylthio-N6-dimethylallyladenosine synthase
VDGFHEAVFSFTHSLHVCDDDVVVFLNIFIQSGSNHMLDKMRRKYTREAYLELIAAMKQTIPGVALSTGVVSCSATCLLCLSLTKRVIDMISGFCDETEADHEDTLSLMREVQFDIAYMYAYSMREKTHAHRVMQVWC